MRLWAWMSAVIFGLTGPVYAQGDPPRVLVINSYTPSFPTTAPMLGAIAEELPGAQIDVEYLSSKAAWSDEYAEGALRQLAALLSRRAPYDVIITTDDHALDLVLLDGGQVFTVPVVSVGINKPDKLDSPSYPHGLTGATEHIDLKGTLRLARRLQPELAQVSLVVDGSASGDAHLALAREQLRASGVTVQEVSLAGGGIDTVEQRLSFSPERAHAVIILSAHITDGVEESFDMVHRQLCHDGARWCYTPFTFALDAGVVGGSVISMADHGRIAGRYAQAILDGTAPSALPVTTTGFQTVITREALQQHPEITLPPDAALFPAQSGSPVGLRLLAVVAAAVLAGAALLVARARRRARAAQAEDVRLKEVGRVAVSVAHDLNNMLTVVQGYQELIEMDHELSDRLREDLSEIGAASQRAARLVHRVLVWGSDKQDTSQPLIVGEHIADLAAVLRRILGHKVQLHLVVDAEALAVMVSCTSLDQMLLNLISNARDAGAQSVQIEVASQDIIQSRALLSGPVASGAWVVIRVYDDGHGIDESTRQKILTRGFSTKDTAGTGVGLDTVVSLVRDEGGAFDLQPRSDGGAIAELWLPRLGNAQAQAVRAPVLAAFRDLHGTERLWIVDDDPDVRRVLRRTFEDFGYTVTTFRSGKDALQALRSAERPDLAIVDVGLGSIRGPELVAQLQARIGAFPAIYMSGSGEQLEDHDLQVVEKPFDTLAMLSAVRGLLRRPPRHPGAPRPPT